MTEPLTESFAPSSLDPADWGAFRAHAHAVLDACVDHLAGARQHPWRPIDDGARTAFGLGDAASGVGIAQVAHELVEKVLPFGTGNTHPRFFGWVHGTGLASGLLAEMVAAAMNSNCGGRDHGAIYVEREVIDWCRRCFGYPESASGLLVAGTSQATVIALAAARTWSLGADSRRDGIQGACQLRAYAAAGVHNAVVKAMELLGMGSDALRRIALTDDGSMDMADLVKAIDEDRADGYQPFCVVATAGSVDRGAFDDIGGLADLCARERLWLHVDGAFGAWARIAGSPWSELVRGIDRADSIAFDFHKWMFVQYDCGAVLIREESRHRAAFAARPAYLASQARGLGGGEPWYCDYGIDLSRGFRALKVWSALRTYGSDALGAAIRRNCEQARLMGEKIGETPGFRLAAPVRLNVCCFSAAPSEWAGEAQDALNTCIAQSMQLSGDAVFSTTQLEGRTVLRAAIVNHRTTDADVLEALAAVARVRDREAGHRQQ